jgi:hypothetical protein
MSDEELIERWLKGNKVKKLPEGEVIGARDLERWSQQRARGLSGSGPDRACVCDDCGKVYERKGTQKHRCPACNAKRWRARHLDKPYQPTGRERVIQRCRQWDVVQDDDGVMATVPFGWPKHKSRSWMIG